MSAHTWPGNAGPATRCCRWRRLGWLGWLGWLGLDAKPGVTYATLILPLIVSGIGISCVFPTLANAAVGSVPVQDAGAPGFAA